MDRRQFIFYNIYQVAMRYYKNVTFKEAVREQVSALGALNSVGCVDFACEIFAYCLASP